jgi:hypothetical protein
MHLHFVQSLEPLQGAGLGQAALSLHLAMRGETKSPKDEKTKRQETGDGRQGTGGAVFSQIIPFPMLQAQRSMLIPLKYDFVRVATGFVVAPTKHVRAATSLVRLAT